MMLIESMSLRREWFGTCAGDALCVRVMQRAMCSFSIVSTEIAWQC